MTRTPGLRTADGSTSGRRPAGGRTPEAETGEVVRLRTAGGRALLAGSGERAEFAPEELDLPPTLVQAFSEWAGVAERVTGGDGSVEAVSMVARRGRQLAARLAAETGVEVDYLDPVTGTVQRVSGERATRSAAPLGRRRTGTSSGEGSGAATTPEPTPWASGLTVSAILAAIVTICLVVVSTGLGEVSVLLAVAVNIAVAAGFAPSIWLGRRVPVWRWVALGTAAGIAVAWFALLLSMLG